MTVWGWGWSGWLSPFDGTESQINRGGFMFEKFLEWAKSNFKGFELEEVLNHHVQSGDYPEEFWESLEPVDGKVLRF